MVKYILLNNFLSKLSISQIDAYKEYSFMIFVFSIQDREVRLRFDAESIRKAVQRRRTGIYPPPEPNHMEHVRQIFERPEYAYLGRTLDDEEEFFHGIVGPEGHQSLVFTSKRLLNIVKTHDIIGSDATFRITPRLLGAEQVFIVSLLAFNKVSNLLADQIIF